MPTPDTQQCSMGKNYSPPRVDDIVWVLVKPSSYMVRERRAKEARKYLTDLYRTHCNCGVVR